MSEVHQTLKEEKERINQIQGGRSTNQGWKGEKAYRVTSDRKAGQYKDSGCFICSRKNYMARECFYHQTNRPQTSRNRGNARKYLQGTARQQTMKREQSNMAAKGKEEFTF